MLFSNERKHTVTLPARLSDGSQPNISFLLQYLVDNVMRDERKELFILEDNVYATVTTCQAQNTLTVPIGGRASWS